MPSVTTPIGARLLSIAETSLSLVLSEEAVRRFIRRNELPAVRFGRRVLVHPDDLQRFIESHRG